jgi:hypothetical protein
VQRTFIRGQSRQICRESSAGGTKRALSDREIFESPAPAAAHLRFDAKKRRICKAVLWVGMATNRAHYWTDRA